MTQLTKPSVGALRAAEKVIEATNFSRDSARAKFVLADLAQVIDHETNHTQLEADSKKLREPATCNAGHKSNLPVALWDCPVCTQLIRNKLQKVEELVRMINSYHERIVKGPTDFDIDSYPTAADIFGKNREVEAALKGDKP